MCCHVLYLLSLSLSLTGPQMVVYEAARAMVNLKNVTVRELHPAVSVLQMFLTSAKPTTRFAAVKTLNRVRECISPCVSLWPHSNTIRLP